MLRIRSIAVRLMAASLTTLGAVSPIAGATTAPALEPYTTPDKTASAGVPAGWKVVRGDNSVIAMTGPHGEKVSLGVTVIVLNAPSSVKPQKSTADISYSQPYTTDLKDKFETVWQFAAKAQGQTPPEFTFESATALKVAPILGQCGRTLGSVAESSKPPANFEAAMCSLPPDFGGAYKNIIIYAQVPTSLAASERATAEAVIKSYRIPSAELKKKLGPVYATPKFAPGGSAPGSAPGTAPMAPAGSMSSIWAQANAVDTASDCFDLTVLRETPAYQLPAKCGGTAPN